MKKYQFKSYTGMAAVCAMLTLASCGNDIELTEAQSPVKGGYKVTLTAKQESCAINSATRTAVDADDNTKVLWQTGDTITVFDGTNTNCTFKLSKGAGTSTGKFEGTLVSLVKDEYCAVYPATPDATIDADHTVSGLTLPVEQIATPGGFDPKAAIMTARGGDIEQNLGYFRHVCSFVQIITDRAYSSITFTAKGNERIAGEFSATVGEDGISTVTPAVAASSTVSLVPAEGETEIQAGTYLIAILPGTLSEGFTINCAYDEIEEEYSMVYAIRRSYSDNTDAFIRKHVVNMGTVGGAGWIEMNRCFVELGVSVKWAASNVGSNYDDVDEFYPLGVNPSEYGDYFAWGETEPRSDYGWENYKWCNGTEWTLTKYNTYEDNGVVDNRTELAREDDAAYVRWGGKSRMPTYDEVQELMDNCYWEWTSNYKSTGKAGYIVYKVWDNRDKGKMKHKGSNVRVYGHYNQGDGHHIFLPCAGLGAGGNQLGRSGFYWTSTLGTDRFDNGRWCGEWYLVIGFGDGISTETSTSVKFNTLGGRCDCQSIRAVHP